MTTFNISSGQTSSGITLGNRDIENVLSGGVAISTVVSSGGADFVSAGGVANGPVLFNGGREDILSGGLASGTTVQPGGVQSVRDGGVISRTLLNGVDANGFNATAVVFSGGVANATTVSGGSFGVNAGGTGIGTIVSNGGTETVGGTARGTIVTSRSTEVVDPGGVTSGTAISGGGQQLINSSGVASGAVVGGLQVIMAGGVAVSATITSGGEQRILSGGVASASVLNVGATLRPIGLNFVSGGTATLDQATDLLTVNDGGQTYTQQLSGNYAGDTFQLASAANGGLLITVNGTPCYCRGTLILTNRGEVAVEDLQIGDHLVTHAGVARPIRWIGRRSYAGRFAAGNADVLPVHIRAGALADGIPRRDLFVSPLHAMYLDGMLFPAAALVNGRSITQVKTVDQVDYFHLELDTHDVIFAEGAPSESFVDDGSRGMFHNAEEHRALHPDAERGPAMYCAPRIDHGYALDAGRRRIDARAGLVRADTLGALRGCLDVVDRDGVHGWAQSVDYPEIAVCLDILVDGALVAQALANRDRPDLAQAGLGSGRHGFRVALPPSPPSAHRVIEVRRSADGAALAHSPLVLAA